MTVIVRKPNLNIREELSALKKPTGVFGEQVMRAQTADDFYGVVGTNRNRIINGGFDVWQRSAGPVTGGGYTTADRWFFPASGETSQRVANDRNFSIPYALQVTADGGGYGMVVQRVEDARTLSSGYATLSFWAKSSAVGSFRLAVDQTFDGSSPVYIIDNTTYFNMNAANVWQKFTATLYMPSVAGKTIGSNSYLTIAFGANSGIASRVMTYSEIQLEGGTVATPFEHRHIGTELALCQRYYQQIGGGTGDTPFMGSAASSTRGYGVYSFPVTMRAAPAVSINGGWSWVNPSFTSSIQWTASTVLFVNQRNLTFEADVASGLTQGFALIGQTFSGGGDLIKFNAEL
jgi:hypothetical protein